MNSRILAFLCACFLAASSPAAWAAPSSAAPATATRTSVLYDPGPHYRCYQVAEENPDGAQGYELNPTQDNSECAPFFIAQRADSGCADFGAVMPSGDASCPTWKFVTYGWYYRKTATSPSEFRVPSGPGYDVRVKGGDGAMITTTLVNDAHGKPDPCTLREVTFSYEYPSSSFRRHADWSAYTLDDGDRFVVKYDARIDHLTPSDCPTETRTFLTTDFIYDYTDDAGHARTNVLSMIHYDATGLSLPGPIFWNACTDDGATPGCRLAVRGTQIPSGQTTALSMDFKALVLEYSAWLGHPGVVPPGALIRSVQVVSSNRGSDATVTLHGAKATLVSGSTR